MGMPCRGSLLTDTDLQTFRRFGGQTRHSLGLYNLINGTWDHYEPQIDRFLAVIEDSDEKHTTKAEWIGVIIDNRSQETQFDRTLDLIRGEFSQFTLSKQQVCFLYGRTVYPGPDDCSELQSEIVNKAIG